VSELAASSLYPVDHHSALLLGGEVGGVVQLGLRRDEDKLHKGTLHKVNKFI